MPERVMIVTIDFNKRDSWPVEDIAAELEELVTSCGGHIAWRMVCKCDKPTANFLIGKGKVEEIADICVTGGIDTVIFSNDLKGSQQRNLEEVVKVKTIDRTQLILDIFARRAKSQEGKMQVELAQLQYLLPRLTGKGVELSRLGGGIGTVGPGETKLEVDRRRIADRIAKLKRDLKGVAQDRKLTRKKRNELKIPTVSLVGYTNAGKSTLLNALTDANQLTFDGLFTTLDPLSRQLILPNHQKIVLSDTVGFMYELPYHLIESFKATLEEVQEADLLLHVLDVSNPKFRNLHDAVMDVLKELDSHDKPMVTVLNKIDKLKDKTWLKSLEDNFPNSVSISALKKENLSRLVEKISELLTPTMVEIDAKIPINRMDLVSLAHKEGHVHSIEYSADSIHIRAAISLKIASKFS